MDSSLTHQIRDFAEARRQGQVSGLSREIDRIQRLHAAASDGLANALLASREKADAVVQLLDQLDTIPDLTPGQTAITRSHAQQVLDGFAITNSTMTAAINDALAKSLDRDWQAQQDAKFDAVLAQIGRR